MAHAYAGNKDIDAIKQVEKHANEIGVVLDYTLGAPKIKAYFFKKEFNSLILTIKNNPEFIKHTEHHLIY